MNGVTCHFLYHHNGGRAYIFGFRLYQLIFYPRLKAAGRFYTWLSKKPVIRKGPHFFGLKGSKSSHKKHVNTLHTVVVLYEE